MIIFNSDGHQYISVLPDGIEWVSVSQLISNFKEEFLPIPMSIKCSKNKKSKWYGMDPEEIRWVWKNKADRSCEVGTKYHAVQEAELLSCETIEMYGEEFKVQAPIVEDGVKKAPEQKIENGWVYPEHMCYLKTAGVCGQVDRVEIINNVLSVVDFKTNEKIETESYFNPYSGKSKMMLAPLSHIEDSNFWHYSLQLSTYAYMMLRHNPNLSVGNLIIEHAVFETDGEDQYGDPVVKMDDWGNPAVKDIVQYPAKYLKSEVEAMFNWLKTNRHNLRKKT
jgi:hypothetical protein